MKYRDMLAAACAVLVAAAGAACSPQQAGKQPAEAAANEAAPPVAAPARSAGDDAPPVTVGGIYIDKGACPGEGCALAGKIKAYEAADLFDKAGPDAAVIGKISKGAWVEIIDTEDHVVPPARRGARGQEELCDRRCGLSSRFGGRGLLPGLQQGKARRLVRP